MSGLGVPVLAGSTAVPELVALLARARLVVANDSGAAHVASAVGTPVVSIFGPTAPELGYAAYGPATLVVEQAGLVCRPCGRHGSKRCPLGHFRCMRELTGETVLESVDALLRATSREPPEEPGLAACTHGWGEGAPSDLQRVAPG